MNLPKLFIGGTWDGQTRKVPGYSHIKVPILRQPSPTEFYTHKNYEVIEHQIYRLEVMRTDKTSIDFYVLESLPLEIALNMLLANYRPEKVKDKDV